MSHHRFHTNRTNDPTNPLQKASTCSRWLAAGTVVMTGGHLLGVPALTAPMAMVVAGLGFVAGIPHGAVDHLMAKRLAGRPSLLVIAAVYAATAAAAWALLQWAGPIALLVAVLFSALHFGLGELEVARQLIGWQPGRLPAAAIAVAGSGALLLPLARAGDQLRGVATAVSPGFAALICAMPVRIGLFMIWLIAAVIAVGCSLRSGRHAVAFDIVLVGALGMLAPPLIAFAVWFGCWHALRHSARMVTLEPGCAALLATGRGQAAVLRLVRLAALPSLAALAAVAALGWFAVAAPDPATVLAEVLRLLLALTVPHMVVVLWLDCAANRMDESSGVAGSPARVIPA